MGAKCDLQSNLFLPFGKVRMGYPTGKVRMVLRSGWGLVLNILVNLGFILVYRSSRCQGAAKLHRNVGCSIPVESLLS